VPPSSLDVFQQEAPRLRSIAFRLLGTSADADDAVQETYLRWHGLPERDRAAIDVPAAWLTRVTSRICLDELGTARARREQYVGEWLPEPVPEQALGGFAGAPASSGDPLDRIAADESVSTALLIVLESLTPAERVALVLHDVFALSFAEIAAIVGRTQAACRQLATSARRRVRDRDARRVTAERHDDAVRAFAAACAGGDLATLVAVLDPSVVLRSDGGGVVSAARRPVQGALNVARFLFGIIEKNPAALVEQRRTADGLTLVFSYDDVVAGVVTLAVSDAAPADAAPPASVVSAIWIMMNPAKLPLWNSASPD